MSIGSNAVRIASRPSRLALAQARLVLDRIGPFLPDRAIEIVPIHSEGDHRQSQPLREFGDKAVFVAAIEQALIDGQADIAVHSLKDVPVAVTRGLWLPGYLLREDPRDVLVSRSGAGLAGLKPGARVGTSSLRRVEQLGAVRSDVEYVDIRGNVETRLAKVKSGEYEAVALAAAGLLRLGLGGDIAEWFDPTICTPAPGQGIIAIQCRENYELGEELIAAGDSTTAGMATAERTLAQMVGATCTTSFGALASVRDDVITLEAYLGGTAAPQRRASVQGPSSDPHAVAHRAAQALAD